MSWSLSSDHGVFVAFLSLQLRQCQFLISHLYVSKWLFSVKSVRKLTRQAVTVANFSLTCQMDCRLQIIMNRQSLIRRFPKPKAATWANFFLKLKWHQPEKMELQQSSVYVMCSFLSNLYNKREAGAVFVFNLLTDQPSVYHWGFLRVATLPLNPNWFIIHTVKVIEELFIYVERYRLKSIPKT